MTAAALLAPIRERDEKATRGPWIVDAMDAGHSCYEMNVWVSAGDGDSICDMDGLARSQNEAVAQDDGYADAEFIAAARTDVPRLLAALDGVLALHTSEDDPDHSYRDSCFECLDTWPCPTVAAVVAALQEGEA